MKTPTGTADRTGRRRDLLAAAAGVLLVTAAVLVGRSIRNADRILSVHWPPLLASWHPHAGPGTPAALAVAAAVVAYGPPLADRIRPRALPPAAWAASLAWIFSLALIDGWGPGVAERLTTRNEYLSAVNRFQDIGAALRGFDQHILLGSPDNWPTHVAGHPPGATLTFVLLDHIGLGGGAWAGTWCIVVGGSAVPAALIALRALAGERLARRAAPFLVLAPVAVWAGTSADAYFTAVAAWSVALLAVAATRSGRLPRLAALGSGLLYGLTCYLSYGLTLIAVPLLAVLVLSRTARPLPLVLLGALVVPAVFTLAGYDWWEGYRLLVERYHQGAGGLRPYSYWVWANLACTTIAAGLATVAGLRRALAGAPAAVRALRGGAPCPAGQLILLALAALAALLAADLSGLSKAETERIWQPFILWLLPLGALLPTATRRGWLTAQAVVALLVNHLLWTGW
ncbi:hypothetical protein OG520_21180 [Streptomyces sp. NBC_00984]|uniref:hypothetical protein n=1 Tax=Streptomyces sp. NBC_00984 TaxID=2903700 RepID=UPI00386A61DF|nr:hypothetical protein OG520_21180 [Streptomyces sp. NBC_00984]